MSLNVISVKLFLYYRGVGREGAGGAAAPQILADQKAPPGSGGAPHYYLPPRIFDPCCTPVISKNQFLKTHVAEPNVPDFNFFADFRPMGYKLSCCDSLCFE